MSLTKAQSLEAAYEITAGNAALLTANVNAGVRTEAVMTGLGPCTDERAHL